VDVVDEDTLVCLRSIERVWPGFKPCWDIFRWEGDKLRSIGELLFGDFVDNGWSFDKTRVLTKADRQCEGEELAIRFSGSS
jgi:hypothetical protein